MRVVTVADADRPDDEDDSRCERIARQKAAQLVALGTKATSEVRHDSPAKAILVAADAVGADLIVVGSRCDSGLRRMVVGSTAREILYGASCSVIVARQQPTVELDETAAFALGYAS